jgi:hypothetical protein
MRQRLRLIAARATRQFISGDLWNICHRPLLGLLTLFPKPMKTRVVIQLALALWWVFLPAARAGCSERLFDQPATSSCCCGSGPCHCAGEAPSPKPVPSDAIVPAVGHDSLLAAALLVQQVLPQPEFRDLPRAAAFAAHEAIDCNLADMRSLFCVFLI